MYAFSLLLALALPQRPDSLSAQVREYVTVDTALLALTHVLLLDGTGAAPKPDHTIVIRAGKIAAAGPAASVQIPAGARTMDLTGSTVIPGLIGLHDHLFYTAAGGRAVQMSYTGPRLYLGSGVTTIRTTGSRSPYAEINLKDAIDHGWAPGPRIHITAPYITGAQGGGAMAIVASPEAARRFVAYWGAEGATWIKAYTDIRRSELSAAIQEFYAERQPRRFMAGSDFFNRTQDFNPGAVETVSEWHRDGHWIHITSHRREYARDATARWLDRIGMPYDDLHCSFDKVSRCVELGIDVLVDDSPVNLVKAREVGIAGATLVHPWNEEIVAAGDAIGAENWAELRVKLRPVLA